jgi:predicted small lipoprotein YifL
MKLALLAALAVALLGGCGGRGAMAAPPHVAASVDWRIVATVKDRGRLRAWRLAWLDAHDRARASGADVSW